MVISHTDVEARKMGSRLEEAAIIYWTLNGDRFENYIRDQIMVDDVVENCGPLAGLVLRNTLRISEHGWVSAPFK